MNKVVYHGLPYRIPAQLPPSLCRIIIHLVNNSRLHDEVESLQQVSYESRLGLEEEQGHTFTGFTIAVVVRVLTSTAGGATGSSICEEMHSVSRPRIRRQHKRSSTIDKYLRFRLVLYRCLWYGCVCKRCSRICNQLC